MEQVVEQSEWRHLSFAEWLRVLAPVHAQLYLPLRCGGRYSPIREAIFDRRAAMLWTDHQIDHPQDQWWWSNSSDDVWQQASGTLSRFGLLMPRRLFDAVWKLCAECDQDPAPLGDAARGAWEPGPSVPLDQTEWRLLWAAHDALRDGPENSSRRRYGCDPD
jgi:hypothetical protein